MFLVCLDKIDCCSTEWIDKVPDTGVCLYCSGPAVWFTDAYWLDEKARLSAIPSAPYGATAMSDSDDLWDQF